MRDWALDLHIHSLLSPCADNAMTPDLILKRARELGYELLAITDHNSLENAAVFVDKGKEMGIKVFPGMEFQTSEDIHLLCLFENLAQAYQWQEIVYQKLPGIKNRQDIFGEQWVINQEGHRIREVERLLLVGTSLSIEEAVEKVHKLAGLCIAAHIDRQAFSLWGHLGNFPPGLPLDGVELTPHLPRNPEQLAEVKKNGFAYLVSSDAHYPDALLPPQCYARIEKPTLAELKLALKNQAGRTIRTIKQEKEGVIMRELSLHILDIAQNSLVAQAKNISITILEDESQDKMVIAIKDDGRGMDETTLQKVRNPFYTTRTTRKVGLGIPLFLANAQACEGTVEIKSEVGQGTTVEAFFRLSHIDRPPLGDIVATLISLISGSPEVNFFYSHRVNSQEFKVNTLEIKDNLEGLSLNHPEVLVWLQEFFREKEKEIRG